MLKKEANFHAVTEFLAVTSFAIHLLNAYTSISKHYKYNRAQAFFHEIRTSN